MVKKNPKTGKENPIEKMDFESALIELEALVSRMESADLPLEESLGEFERGVKLSRHCQTKLTAAEQRIQLLTEDGVVDFEQANEETRNPE